MFCSLCVVAFLALYSSTMIDVDRLVQFAEQRHMESDLPQLPWEGDHMVAHALGYVAQQPCLATPMRLVKVPAFPTIEDRKPKRLAYHPEFVGKRRKIVTTLLEGTVDDARAAALAKWLMILESNLHASQVGRQIIELQTQEGAVAKMREMLADVMSSKATGTLSGRACALLLYMRWHASSAGRAVPAFPLEESFLYEYICDIRRKNLPASRASSLLEAWNFCVGVLAFEDPGKISDSRRCRGAAHSLAIARVLRRRKDALTVSMVVAVEYAAVFEKDVTLRALYGFCCLLLFGRLRASDGNLIAGSAEGEDFFEGSLLGNKTSKSVEKKNSFLPLVIPLRGLSGLDWWSEFTMARASMGLEDIIEQAEAEEVKPGAEKPLVMPGNAGAGKAQIGADEVSATLVQLLLAAGFAEESVKNIASHSLKATMLTFAGKYGIPVQARQILGFHKVKGEESALNYNRDNLGEPMDQLTELITELREGIFAPDAPRGSRKPKSRDRISAAAQLELELDKTRVELASMFHGAEVSREDLINMGGFFEDHFPEDFTHSKVPVVHSDEDGPLSRSSSEGVSVSGDSAEEEAQDNMDKGFELPKGHDTEVEVAALSIAGTIAGKLDQGTRSAPKNADMKKLYTHSIRGTAHWGNLDSEGRLGCGRILTSIFTESAESPEDVWPKCSQCFPSKYDSEDERELSESIA